jgi:hypothetical protein
VSTGSILESENVGISYDIKHHAMSLPKCTVHTGLIEIVTERLELRHVYIAKCCYNIGCVY